MGRVISTDSHAFFICLNANEERTEAIQIFMKKLILSACCVLALGLASCSTVTSGSGLGILYTGVSEGQIATANPVGHKVGTSSSVGVLGLVSVGDASINTAANSAGIKKISHVDVKKTSILGIYSNYKTVVYGE